MKIIMSEESAEIIFPFEPTSVFIDGVQTFDYTLRGNNVYLKNTVPVGTEITGIPSGALRFIDNSIPSFEPTEGNTVFSDPFGLIEFSLDQSTWYKALRYTLPCTVYARQTHVEPILDVKCRGNIELVFWYGENVKINEQGLVEVITDMTEAGGIEYYVH